MISLEELRGRHREGNRDRSCARMLRLCAARQTLAVSARRAADPMMQRSCTLRPRRRRAGICGGHAALGGHGVATLAMDTPRVRVPTGAERIAHDPHPYRRPPGFPAEGRPELRELLRNGV